MSKPETQHDSPSPHDQPTVIQDEESIGSPNKKSPQKFQNLTTELPAPVSLTLPQEVASTPLSRVDDYELIGEVGRGGMGVVLKARDVRLNRVVALKMLSGGVLARDEDIKRFETEASAAAQLQHPNIVALYDIGTFEGQPYFSMEFVDGSSLAHRVNLGVLPSRLAASYLERTARAVHFAHGKGILHRDLKPANVLLDENDQPKITDFGLAKSLHVDSGQTRTGTVIGTPSYMAPEQANASKDISVPCDIYSLGAVLYELITGHPPFIGESALATLQMVAFQDPVPPHLLNPKVDRDLETICLKCLEKEPSRRYETAEELANDLRRYLKGEPISARRLGVAGRTVKWVRRKPIYAVMLLATVLTLSGLALFQWRVAVNEHELMKDAVRANEKSRQREQLLQYFYYLGQMHQVSGAIQSADLRRARSLLKNWVQPEEKRKLRDWEWHFLKRLADGKRTLIGHTRRVQSLAYNHKGTILASSGGEPAVTGEVKIWEAGTGKLLRSLPSVHDSIVSKIAFSPDDTLLATASADHTVHLWDTQTWNHIAALKDHKNHVTSVAFSPDSKSLISADGDGCVMLWKLSSKAPPRCMCNLTEHASGITDIAVHPTKNLFATASLDETVRIWSFEKPHELRILRCQGEVMAVAFHPNGKVLASAGGPGLRRGQVRLWDVDTGKLLRSHHGLSDRILSVAISRDGIVAAGDSDGLVQIWDERRSSEAVRFRADTKPVFAVAFHRDGKRLATGGSDGSIRIWNTSGGQESYRIAGHRRTEVAAYSPDGKILATAGWSPRRNGNRILLWDAKSHKLLRELAGHTSMVRGIAFHPDSKRLVSVGVDRSIYVYHIGKSQPLAVIKKHETRLLTVAIHPDGNTIATGDDDTVRLWDIRTKRQTRKIDLRHGAQTIAFSPNGRYLAAGDRVGVVYVWDLQKNTSRKIQGHKGPINSLVFSPDSVQLATGGKDQIIRIWDASLENHVPLEGTTRSITSLVFHPKGRRLASAGKDRVVRIWDLTTLQEILQLHGPQGDLTSVAFSPDGWRLAAAGSYMDTLVWDARPE